jgi:tight adherence protein C
MIVVGDQLAFGQVDLVALVLGLAWATVVVLVAAAHEPPRRVPIGPERPGGRPPPAGGHTIERGSGTPAGRRGPSEALGRTIRGLAGRPADSEADRRAGWAALATAVLIVVAPPFSPVPAVWATIRPTLATRRTARAHEAAVVDQLPDIVDLLSLTTSAGLPVTASFAAIGSRPGGPFGAGLSAAAAHAARGGTTAEALALLGRATGPTARPLIDALAEHDRYGTPLRPALDRVAIESRLRRRRHAEEAARRLPVTLLFPLVLTVLPAFVLLTVVPILAGSLGSLSP